MEFFPLEIYNITVVDTPLLKDYYWNSLNLSSLNRQLYKFISQRTTPHLSRLETPLMSIPPMPVNSNPIKIILHLCNNSDRNVNFLIKRIQRCECFIKETQVAINKYKKMYHCPHRNILDISPRNGNIISKANDILVLRIFYYTVGQHSLEFEMIIDDNFLLVMKFQATILDFDPAQCMITNSLFPVKDDDCYSFYQPIWFYNPYSQSLLLDFTTKSTCLKFYNSKINIKRYSIYPLIVKFIPNCNLMMLALKLQYCGIETELILSGTSVRGHQILPVANCPKNDIDCDELPYIIYENSLSFKINYTCSSTKMVAVHNYSKYCIECKWIRFELPKFFNISVEPNSFLCRPEHQVLCVIKVEVEQSRGIFHHVPLTCEIHRFRVPPLQTEYEDLHSRIESIDDPLIFEPTLITKMLVNINLVIDGVPKFNYPLRSRNSIVNLTVNPSYDRKKIEQKLWKYIFNDDFLNYQINRKKHNYTYCPVSNIDPTDEHSTTVITYNETVSILRHLTANALDEISKEWRFIPKGLVL